MARLLRAAAKLSTGDADQQWLAATIEGVIEDGGSFDEAFGNDSSRRLGHRDALLRELHQRFFPEDSSYEAAKKIERLVKEVKKAQQLGKLDQIALDDPRHLIAEAIKARHQIPQWRQLINVLALQ
jgi:hypothetical protein